MAVCAAVVCLPVQCRSQMVLCFLDSGNLHDSKNILSFELLGTFCS